MTLPNWLTVLRILLVPVVVANLQMGFAWHDQLAAAGYAVAAVTDTLDGHLARSRQLVTDLGKFLDPLADKLLVVSVLAALAYDDRLSLWVVLVVVVREVAVTVLRSIGARRGVVVASTGWGKSKTLSQNLMIGLVILRAPFGWLATPADLLIGVAIVATVLSGLDYAWKYRSLWSR